MADIMPKNRVGITVFNCPPCEQPGGEHQRLIFMMVSRMGKNALGVSGFVKKSAMLAVLHTK
eukprot:1619496-Pleurochrysis_carterae.AAC.1